MTNELSIDLVLPEKLKNPEYRRQFFWAEASALIAAQVIALRKRRGKNQTALAEMIGTQQPAISRIERADYQSWNFSTLRKIADALDARLRVFIEPSEDVVHEYEDDIVGTRPHAGANAERAFNEAQDSLYARNAEAPRRAVNEADQNKRELPQIPLMRFSHETHSN